jgi:two-component system OmpR family sensor kinase
MPHNRPKARNRAPLTLRTKLVSVAVLLAFLVAATIGAVSILTLQRSLQERLDAQLASAFDRAVTVLNAPGFQTDRSQSIAERRGHELNESDAESELEGDGDDVSPGQRQQQLGKNYAPTPAAGIVDATQILNGPAQAPGTIALVLDNGTLTGGYLGENGSIVAVTDAQLGALSKTVPDAEPHTLELGHGLGDYRVQGAIVDENAVIVGLPLRDVRQTVLTLTGTIVSVAVVGLFALAVFAALIIRRTMRPLEQVADAADTVAALDLHKGEVTEFDRINVAGVDERTEVGRVMTAVNSMMNNVESALISREASEQKVRSFVADASHELRTPLASIRGYSELVRRMGGDLPADMQQAIGRIESESVRMTVLVEDLLLLARLDEGSELSLTEVNLSQVATDALSDAAVAAPGHVWAIEGAEEPLVVLADQNRLHQAIANLLANARTHTPEGTEVTVEVARDGNEAVVSVTDNGPGIPDDLQATVFARFVRGDSSRNRASSSSSTGLGLSIVQALVDAHHGTITLSSKPGNTRFEIRLPLA